MKSQKNYNYNQNLPQHAGVTYPSIDPSKKRIHGIADQSDACHVAMGDSGSSKSSITNH